MNIARIEETKLWQRLNSIDTPEARRLAANIPAIATEAFSRLKLVSRFFPEYTLHDEVHSLRVIEIMSIIAGESINELNHIEITLLILSAIFHDIGMVPSQDEYSAIEKSREYSLFRDSWIVDHSAYQDLLDAMQSSHISSEERTKAAMRIAEMNQHIFADYLRISHASRSGEYVRDRYSSDNRLEVSGWNLSGAVAKLCISHSLPVESITPSNGFLFDESIGTYTANIVYVALLLRLADILDFDRERTPKSLFDSIHFTNSISISEWEKHRGVQGWLINKDIIRFTMAFSEPAYENTARKFMDWIDDELAACIYANSQFPSQFNKYKLALPIKVNRDRIGPKDNAYIYSDLEFSLSKNELIRLLMTDNLYSNASLCIRELLQNSADAIRLRQAQFKSKGITWIDGKIEFEHSETPDGIEIVKCIDNGSGMDETILRKFFSKIGKSYYKSPEFNQLRSLLRESGADFEPCSQFGIGFMSCFMLGDKIQILTRKDNGYGKDCGKPLVVDISGTAGLISVREGNATQAIGTSVTIFSRKKPKAFDAWVDKVRLCSVIRGYGLGIEFPIECRVSIPEIREKTTVIPGIRCIQSELSLIEDVKSKTYNFDFKLIDHDLSGEMSETFLLDKDDLPTWENECAKWEATSGNHKTKKLVVNGASIERDITGDNYNSICIDGVLVSGHPGKTRNNPHDRSMLGWNGNPVDSTLPFIIDIRGKLKPEITPSRKPPQHSFGDLTSRWRRIERFINIAESKIISQLSSDIKDCSNVGERFFKILISYSLPWTSTPIDVIAHNLQFPFSNPAGVEWKRLRDAYPISINTSGDAIQLTDKTGSNLGSNELQEFADSLTSKFDTRWLMTQMILISSSLEYCGNQFILPRCADNITNSPISSIMNLDIHLRSSGMPFSDSLSKYVSAKIGTPIMNMRSDIVDIAIKSKLTISKPSDIEAFAASFVFNFSSHIQKARYGELPKYSRFLKRLGALYTSINWQSHDSSAKAPYFFFVDGKEFSITEEMLTSWSEIQIETRPD